MIATCTCSSATKTSNEGQHLDAAADLLEMPAASLCTAGVVSSDDISTGATQKTDGCVPLKFSPDPRDDTDPIAPPPELRQAAFEKLSETYDSRHEGLRQLRERVAAHVVDAGAEKVTFCRSDDDSFLVVFLRCKKMQVEKAWEEYFNYCKFYTNEGWLKNINTEIARQFLRSRAFEILPSQDYCGRVILYLNCSRFVPIVEERGHHDIDEVVKAVFYVVQLLLFCDVHAQIHGAVILGDLNGFKLRIMSYLSFHQYKLCLHLCQYCLPLRANAFYMQNEPRYVRAAVASLRPFMKDKVRRSFLCCGADTSVMQSVIPLSSLPTNFGGTLPQACEAHIRRWLGVAEKFVL